MSESYGDVSLRAIYVPYCNNPLLEKYFSSDTFVRETKIHLLGILYRFLSQRRGKQPMNTIKSLLRILKTTGAEDWTMAMWLSCCAKVATDTIHVP